MDVDLYTQTPVAARADMGRLGVWAGAATDRAAAAAAAASGVAGDRAASDTGPAPSDGADSGAADSAPAHPSPADRAHDLVASLQSGLRKLTSLGGAHHEEREDQHVAVSSGEPGSTTGGRATAGGLVLASWRMALDGGRGLDGEPHLAGTTKPDLCRLSAGTAARLGLHNGEQVTVTGPAGAAVTLPLAITGMADGVVWLPGRVRQTPLVAQIGAAVGDRVRVERFHTSEGHGR